jgi:hypothetical protein
MKAAAIVQLKTRFKERHIVAVAYLHHSKITHTGASLQIEIVHHVN